MQITSEEAARSLAAVEASRTAMRSILRANRGHWHLWLWGAIWIAMAMLAQFRGEAGMRLFPWIVPAGILASLAIGITQGRRIRMPVDRRFLGVLGAVIAFAIIAPALLMRTAPDGKALFAYGGLAAMLCYVIAGIWFDTYLLRLGAAMAALILIGLFCFPAVFWWWIAVFGGGPLLVAGCPIRYGAP